MPETYNLTTPETKPAVTNQKYKIVAISLDEELSWIRIRLRGEQNQLLQPEYGGPFATPAERASTITLIRALCVANLTTKSLPKRILERLAADGKLPAGSITGTPD